MTAWWTLRHRPGVAAAVSLTLSLGIAANTVVFRANGGRELLRGHRRPPGRRSRGRARSRASRLPDGPLVVAPGGVSRSQSRRNPIATPKLLTVGSSE
jgi:hypothetical protein